MDDMDRAQEINEQLQADALASHFRTGIANAMYGSEITCMDCSEEIPEARRRAVPGCTKCVSCQEQHEILSNWR